MSEEVIMEETKLEKDLTEDQAFEDDRLWQVKTGLNEESLCGVIETLIFMSEKPINIQKIKSSIDEDIPIRTIHNSILRLQNEYELSHHGIRLQEVAEGFQFRTKAIFSKYVQNLCKISSLELTPATLEVLAIIAYKQPISKTKIENIRGVDSSHLVRVLMDKKLVRITGRSEELGRPSILGTTSEFLEVFNLKDLTELPAESELESLVENEKKSIEEIKEVVSNKSDNLFAEYELEEIDKLKESIKAISADTLFTKSLKKEEKKLNSDNTEERPKTAFELLEDFIEQNKLKEQNKLASESDLLTTVAEPQALNLEEQSNEESTLDWSEDKPKETQEEGYLLNEDEVDAALDDLFPAENIKKIEQLEQSSSEQFDNSN